MRTTRFFWKIFGGTVAVITITAVVVYLAALPTIERDVRQEAERHVAQEAELAVELFRASYSPGSGELDRRGLEELAERLPESRFTFIAEGGEVLFDSWGDVALMDNHASRPELASPGEPVTRYSRTVDEDMVYVALVVEVGGEPIGHARVAVSLGDPDQRARELGRAVRNGAFLAALISFSLAWVFARRVTKPISEISALVTDIGAKNTTRRLDVRRDDELGRLAMAVNQMADELQGQIQRVERDRTEREAIFSAMADGILAVDANQNVLFVNRPARQLLGNLEGRLKGSPVWELIRNRDLLEVVERCLEEETRVGGEARIPNEDGHRDVELTAVPMGTAGGEHQGCVLELRDVTDLRRLEAMRQDFVSNVSHELKTPLTAMRGYTESMLEDADMPESLRRSFLEKAHANVERLAAMVSDLLSLSRLQSDEHELSFEPLDLDKLAPAVLSDLSDLADSRQIRLELECDEPGLTVAADASALSMAMSNLVANAIQYSPEGEVVRVQVGREGPEVRFAVSDRGPGIPPGEQERIFERFYRVDKARSRKLGGTGLGLSIVKNVMATHGGRIELESRVGLGSRFSLFLEGA